MPALIERLADEDGTVRQKALMALSCIIRHNDTGLTAFVKAGVFFHFHVMVLPYAAYRFAYLPELMRSGYSNCGAD